MAQMHQPLASANIEVAPTFSSEAPSTEATQPSREEAINNPVADPRAIVLQGNARFTVLTPELIRMEWAADGKFEDHASFVFINRRLPVP
jgi:alpha-glucosidase